MRTAEQHRELIREIARKEGLTIEPAGAHALRITGPNVNILTADLATVEPRELRPFKAGVWQSRRHHFGR
ncbi:MAG TPA: PLP-dependent lyase/thiolase [Rhodocyclaceae bacterium]|nr:PLP-dependent lyase/thiolase [Rhodocyclaceae bacterium]